MATKKEQLEDLKQQMDEYLNESGNYYYGLELSISEVKFLKEVLDKVDVNDLE